MKKVLKAILLLSYQILQRILNKKFEGYIYNVNLNPIVENQKRVLICYISDGFICNESNFKKHTNVWDFFLMTKYFIDNGYVVDVVSFNEEFRKSNVAYDIVIGFGDIFQRTDSLKEKGKKILYLTENHPEFAKASYAEREIYYKQRKGKLDRFLKRNSVYTIKDIECSDVVICMLNKYSVSRSNWRNKHLEIICPTSHYNSNFKLINKNWRVVKNKFLWFGSPGALHKGLDILIDAFSHLPNLQLYIAGGAEEELSLFKIKKYLNIFNLGFLDVFSNDFLTIVNDVAWVILPSCSEGCSTSVLTCMRHGLIPITTPAAGLEDNGEFGITLQSFEIEYIREVVLRASAYNDDLLEDLSRNSIKYANSKSSREAYYKQFSNIMERLITANGHGNEKS